MRLILPSIDSRDGPLVGTPEILQSPLVVEAPDHVNQPVPVPSVYMDDRGEIHNLRIGGSNNDDDSQRINLMYTKAGVKRSGDIHATTQHDFVFDGHIKVWTLGHDGATHIQSYGSNDYIVIPPYTPHVFEFDQDSVLAEWWDGDFYAWFYEPYRKLVEDSFVSDKPGEFAHYAMHGKEDVSDTTTQMRALMRNKGLWTGIAVGMSLGFVFARKIYSR